MGNWEGQDDLTHVIGKTTYADGTDQTIIYNSLGRPYIQLGRTKETYPSLVRYEKWVPRILTSIFIQDIPTTKHKLKCQSHVD